MNFFSKLESLKEELKIDESDQGMEVNLELLNLNVELARAKFRQFITVFLFSHKQ